MSLYLNDNKEEHHFNGAGVSPIAGCNSIVRVLEKPSLGKPCLGCYLFMVKLPQIGKHSGNMLTGQINRTH